jgi:LytS/YehU family sensor histidine kinase
LEGLPRALPMRLAVLGALVFACASGSSLLLHAYYGHGFSHLPPPLRLLADSLHWGLPAVFLVLIGDVHQRALAADSAAHAAELARAQQGQGESEQQLALLQAQIEPHFLFNVLGNVRRLYRTEPQAGADAIGSLMRYLRSALPQVRNASGTLGDEIELVRAYLQLQRMRMGPRLGFSIECEPKLQAAEFPPMLAMTLVENAIRHGVEPAGGGRVGVRALRDGDRLVLEVVDDGVGFGGAPSSGTGVGLANVRRQLAARHGEAGRLRLEAAAPRGARATLSLPLRAADTASPA